MMNGEDMNSCLARFPQHAAELEPLLKTALEARNAAAVKPDEDFRARAAYEYQSAMIGMPEKKARAFTWRLRWALPLAIVAVLLLGATGTAFAATNSLPDSPLYSVKLALESVQLAFTPSDQGKAELYARFVDYRIEEIVKMSEKGDSAAIEKATERMESQFAAIVEIEFGETGKTMLAYSGAQDARTAVPTTTVPAMQVPPTATPPDLENAPPPTPTATMPPSPEIVALPTTAPETGDATALTDKEKLRQRLIEEAEQNLAVLREQLARAPAALKPAIQKAIERAEEGYRLAIASLE
jgi:hypothetical protein